MQVIYKSFDGKQFESEADCLQHEAELKGSVKMWNVEGHKVAETFQAWLVYLDGDEAAAIFQTMCSDAEDAYGCEGIEDGDEGYFYWDEWNDRYQYLSSDVIKCIRSISED